MFIYKLITGKISADSDNWNILLRQEPFYNERSDNDNDRHSWFLSNLSDTPENRTFLSLKYGIVEFISVLEYEQYIEDNAQEGAERKRFQGYLRDAKNYYKNQLTT